MEKIKIALPTFRWEPVSAFDLSNWLSGTTDYDYDLYISGQMTGVENHNYPRFNKVADYFRSLGLRVFNPAENFNGNRNLTRHTYLRKDIKNLCRSGAIILMDEWFDSDGAVLEFYVAEELGLEIYHISKQNTVYERIN